MNPSGTSGPSDFLHGRRHRELLAWLRGPWFSQGRAISVVQGFPGVGKTRTARDFPANLLVPHAFVELPEGDAGSLDDLLMDAAVVRMPSRTEGFGLVGLEAIAIGVPVLISDRSGLGETIKQRCPALARHHVVAVTAEMETDAAEWARAIERVLFDRKAAFARAEDLRVALQAILSWEETVTKILTLLGV